MENKKSFNALCDGYAKCLTLNNYEVFAQNLKPLWEDLEQSMLTYKATSGSNPYRVVYSLDQLCFYILLQSTNPKEMLEDAKILHEKKNHDYGDSFKISVNKYGLVASLTRMSDKYNRFISLQDSQSSVDEKLEDTIMDLFCYAVMTKEIILSKLP